MNMARIRIDDLPLTEARAHEQEALVLGAGLPSSRPTLEALEGREVPAGIDLANGVLTIQGNDWANRSQVTSADGQVLATLDQTAKRFDAKDVREIVFHGE